LSYCHTYPTRTNVASLYGRLVITSLIKSIAYRMNGYPKYEDAKEVLLKSVMTIGKGIASKYLLTEKTSEEYQKNFLSEMVLAEAEDTIILLQKIEDTIVKIRKSSDDSILTNINSSSQIHALFPKKPIRFLQTNRYCGFPKVPNRNIF
jgi:hypothetical protein